MNEIVLTNLMNFVHSGSLKKKYDFKKFYVKMPTVNI